MRSTLDSEGGRGTQLVRSTLDSEGGRGTRWPFFTPTPKTAFLDPNRNMPNLPCTMNHGMPIATSTEQTVTFFDKKYSSLVPSPTGDGFSQYTLHPNTNTRRSCAPARLFKNMCWCVSFKPYICCPRLERVAVQIFSSIELSRVALIQNQN